MEPRIDLFTVILLLGATQGFFLALAIINTKTGSAAAHRLLAFLTLVFSTELFYEFLSQSGYLHRVIDLQFIYQSIDLLYGPLIYLYALMLTSRQQSAMQRRDWLHFLPFVFSLLAMSPYWLLDDDQRIALTYDSITDGSEGFVLVQAIQLVVSLLSIIQIFIYLGFTIGRLLIHSQGIRGEFSYMERINLNWLRNLVVGLCLLYCIYLFELFVAPLFKLDTVLGDTVDILTVILIYTMGYLGLRQPLIFSFPRHEAKTKLSDPYEEANSGQGLHPDDKVTEVYSQKNSMNTRSIETANNNVRSTAVFDETQNHKVRPSKRNFQQTYSEEGLQKKKYQKSALDKNMSLALLHELEKHMALAQPYLDNKITLTQLAIDMGISSNYLSQVINEQLDKNFFDFINEYRVEEAKKYLVDPEKDTFGVLGIAQEAGFNSKTAFYTAFKKYTGLTPIQYKKSAMTR